MQPIQNPALILTKPFYHSKTIIGNFISILIFASISLYPELILHQHPSETMFLITITGIFTNIFSIYGRITAKHRLHFKQPPKE